MLYDIILPILFGNEMKRTSQQTIERSKYYSRIDYYESLGEENR